MMMKCRDCLFRTDDILEVHEHIETLGHHDYAVIVGGKVVVDWIHIETEVVRGAPE